MSTLASLEARWFMPGPLPPEAVLWLETGGTPAVDARDDHYFSLPGITDLGVKLREGKLEVKRRSAELGKREISPDVVGRIARWHKWSFPLADKRAEVPMDEWIKVTKHRRLRKFAVDSGDRLTPAGAKEFPDRGCTVEVTSLTARGQSWWSVGFEAFEKTGAEALMGSALSLVMQHEFIRPSNFALSLDRSFDYPEWLTRLCDRPA